MKQRLSISISMLLIAVGFMALLHGLGVLKPIERTIRSVITPGSRALYEIGITLSNGRAYGSVDDLTHAYEELSRSYEEQLVDRARLQILEDENANLRDMLGFFRSSTLSAATARVIGKSLQSVGSAIMIDKGTNDGITVGNPVTARNGIMIGKVIRVEANNALVRLINDNQSTVAATVLNTDHSIGLVEGGYGISVRMNFIPQNEAIAIDDIVITSGLEEYIPRGLVIGTVESVEKEAYQPFQRAIITPATNLDKMTIVSVILEK